VVYRQTLMRDDDEGVALEYAALILATIGDMSCQRELDSQIDV